MKEKELTATTIINYLEQINEVLDVIQETEIFQNSKELMDEIGEAMGYIDNTIAIVEKK